MILEVAVLNVKIGQEEQFEQAFKHAQKIIVKMTGYISHEIKKCIEVPNQYMLLVNWDSLKDHTEGFRGSNEYKEWKSLLHHFYDPFPTVEHYEAIIFN